MCEKISIHILNLLSKRFIETVPLRKIETIMKLCVQIEKSYWYFLDEICNGSSKICFEKYAEEIFNLPFPSIHLQNLQNCKTSATILKEYKE